MKTTHIERRLVRRAALAALTVMAVSPVIADRVGAFAPPDATVFISELHYDNDLADLGEAIEVFGPAGTDLTGWTIVLYNGSNGAVYDTDPLPSPIPDNAAGFGTVSINYPVNGIQNGSPDGIALVDGGGGVRQFLSYEGSLTAVGGAANGMVSTDIGISEVGTTPVGQSLQLTGTGTTYGALTWTGPATASFGAINAGAGPPPPPVCPVPPALAPISTIQGTTDVSPCSGETVTVDGVVVADFEGLSPALGGFYVQEQDAEADGDPATSEGLFVFDRPADSVSIGDVVQVTGRVAEFQGQTQLDSVSAITVTASAAAVTAATVTMPFASPTALEAVEGMLVTNPQTLSVTEMFQLGRFGQVVVSSGGRLPQPTAIVEPGADAAAVQAANQLNRLIIDDALNNQNPDPIVYGGSGGALAADNPLRGGDTITGATGVMTYTFSGNSASGNAYRLRPAANPIAFTTANPRPPAAPVVGGTLRVTSFNVLNYFTTLDIGTQANCGPTGFLQECRGAESAVELQRQRDKLLAAIRALDADVIGLIELENTTGVEPLDDIVGGLNAVAGPGAYAYIDTGTIGTDVIKVGIIYRTAAVAPLDAYAIIDSSVDPRFDSDLNRPSLAQTFVQRATGEVVTMVVNHLKSKSCTGAAGANTDLGDGQACFNAARTSAATALVDWLAGNPTGVADGDYLITGDLNSYANEDPIDVLVGVGYTDLAAAFDPAPYSFVFDGQWGTLDYAMASPSLAKQVKGAAEYHINADEASVLDYNTNFKSAAQLVSLYAPDQFRTADHDPILVGLKLNGVNALPIAWPPLLAPNNHKLRDVTVFAITRDFRLTATTITSVVPSEADSGLGPDDLAGDIVVTGPSTVRLRAESYARTGRLYTITVRISDRGQLRVGTTVVFVPPTRRR